MAFTSYTPDKIETAEAMASKTVVTAEHWNNILNMLIAQGNATAQEVYDLIAQLASTAGADDIGAATITGVAGTTVQTVMVGLKALIDLCYTSATTDTLLAQKETIASANQLIKTITFNSSDGKFTITKQDGSQSIIDTAFEKTAVNFAYNPTTQALDLTLADGSVTSVSLSAFITENEFLDSDQLDFSVNNHVVTANIKSGCITEAMLASATLNNLIAYKTTAQTSATAAAASEANALTYKNAANTSATNAKTSETNAKASETNAKASETNSKTSETNAAVSASQIQNLTVSATNLAPGSAASVTKSPITGGYNFAFGIPEGASGVYVGTGDMPANCNVQIDPSGDADGIYTKGEVDSLVDPLETSISTLNTRAMKAVDQRDGKSYSMQLTIDTDGFPVAAFTAIE